jgi:hypothetical protein
MSTFPFDHHHYVAALRAKRGEYQAVTHLSAPQREHFIPLWELQSPDEDVEPGTERVALETHLQTHARNMYRAWGVDGCFVDAELLDDGRASTTGQHALEFFCRRLAELGGAPIPVASPSYSPASQSAAEAVNQQYGTGICIRVTTPDAANAAVVRTFAETLVQNGVLMLDLVVDLEHVTEDVLRLVTPFLPQTLQNLVAIRQWRTLTLMLGSFPQELAPLGRGHILYPRPDWPAWRAVITRIGALDRKPAYGDYAVQYPHFVALPQFVAASANIRYTGESEWHIFRGLPVADMGNVRGHGFDQYRQLADQCRQAVPPYRGPAYSHGDQYIDDCANGTVGTGNNTTWREVGTNQHIVFATELATRP